MSALNMVRCPGRWLSILSLRSGSRPLLRASALPRTWFAAAASATITHCMRAAGTQKKSGFQSALHCCEARLQHGIWRF